MLPTVDFMLPMDVIFVARAQQAITMIAAEAIQMKSTVGRRANKEIILGKRLMTFGALRNE